MKLLCDFDEFYRRLLLVVIFEKYLLVIVQGKMEGCGPRASQVCLRLRLRQDLHRGLTATVEEEESSDVMRVHSTAALQSCSNYDSSSEPIQPIVKLFHIGRPLIFH